MIQFLEILKYTLPSIVVAIIAYLIFDRFLKSEETKRKLILKETLAKEINPQRLQAYERMALFLERIRPTSLVRRLNGIDSIKEYEFSLINNIQSEFDHNLSQQIYINPETWKIIYSAKNSTQNFINECVKRLPEDCTVQDLQEEIIRSSINENNPSNYAMIYLQKDIQSTNK